MALGLCLLLLAGCTLGPSQRPALATSGTGEPAPPGTATSGPVIGPGGPGQQTDPVRWFACNDVDPVDPSTRMTFTVECASVLVASKGTDGSDNQVVEIARARAAGVPQDAPDLVVLSGEPGQNGRSRVASVAAGLSPALRQRVAVLTVDLPGTGQSAAIDCVSGSDARAIVSLGADPTQPTAASALDKLSRSLTFECGDLAGAGLSLLNTSSATDALDAVRAALGRPTLDVLGKGFGATLAAVYADRYPGRVGRIVLDAPSDPLDAADTTAAAVARASEAALDRFAAACPSFDGGCPLGNRPRTAVTNLVAALDNATLGSGDATAGTVLFALLLGLGQPARWPELATALARAAAADTSPITQLLERQLGLDGGSGWLNGSIIYRCNDSPLRISPAQLSNAVKGIRSHAPLFGPFTEGLVGICTDWPAPETALGAVTATGAPPMLVLGAVDDPVAPYDAVRSLAGQLGSASLASWQSGQHGSYPASPCMTGIVDGYLRDGQLPGVGTLCPP